MNPKDDLNLRWVYDRLHCKSIKNISMKNILTLFGSNKIDLADLDLVSIGKDGQGQKQIAFLKILSTNGSLLFGAQRVNCYYPYGGIFDVTSLSALKTHFFLFQDKISFERSTFVIHHESKSLVRLQIMRFLLYSKYVKCLCAQKSVGVIQCLADKRHEHCEKRKECILKTMDLLVSQYACIENISIDESIVSLSNIINEHLSNLLLSISIQNADIDSIESMS